MKIALTAVLVLGLGLGMASPALAKDISVTGNTSVDIGVGSSANVDPRNVDLDVNVGADVDTDAEVNANDSATTDTEGNVESSEEGAGITITRDSVSESEATMIVAAPGMVQTSSDLSAYASAVVKTDENVDSAELSKNEVSLYYNQHAKLFGFLPILVPVKATVESNGEVSVSYPWYGFMLSQTERTNLETRLNAAFQGSVQGEGSLGVDSELSSRTQAMLLEKIHSTMKQNFDASVAANASANAVASVE